MPQQVEDRGGAGVDTGAYVCAERVEVEAAEAVARSVRGDGKEEQAVESAGERG